MCAFVSAYLSRSCFLCSSRRADGAGKFFRPALLPKRKIRRPSAVARRLAPASACAMGCCEACVILSAAFAHTGPLALSVLRLWPRRCVHGLSTGSIFVRPRRIFLPVDGGCWLWVTAADGMRPVDLESSFSPSQMRGCWGRCLCSPSTLQLPCPFSKQPFGAVRACTEVHIPSPRRPRRRRRSARSRPAYVLSPSMEDVVLLNLRLIHAASHAASHALLALAALAYMRLRDVQSSGLPLA